jgi:L-seryl-tRNA(Ser) seleniumtransferase
LPLLALEATLDAWLREDLDRIPAVRMARIPAAILRERASRWAAALAPQIAAEVVATRAVAGGGTYAGDEIASWAIAVRAPDAEAFTERLRRGSPPVVARIEDGAVVFDARTLGEDEDEPLLDAIRRALP